jgi:hypothetical protein
VYKLLVGNPEGKRPLGRPRRRWVNNIEIDLGEVEWGDVDWIRLAKEFGNKPSGFINTEKQWSGFTTGGLSSSAQLHRVS